MALFGGSGGNRNSGFGLNYNSGFGSGKFLPGGDNSGLWSNIVNNQRGYQDRLGNQQQFEFNSALQRDQLAQRDREAQLQAQIQREGLASQAAIARMQNTTALAPIQAKERNFRRIFPILSAQLNAYGRQGQPGSVTPGGDFQFNVQPVLSEQQIQQQVNAQRAGNDTATATRERAMREGMAGRGYGTRSPQAALLSTTLQGQNLAANTANERDLRIGAAEKNAAHMLQGQKYQSDAFAQRQDEMIRRDQIRSGGINAILAILGGLV